MKRTITALAVLFVCGNVFANDDYGMKPGKVELKSASVLAFGPNDVLFVGDTKAATVYAISTGDTKGDAASAKFENKKIQSNLNDMFGGSTRIKDIVANPKAGNLFLACETEGKPSIVYVTEGGRQMKQLPLSESKFSKVALKDAPEDKATGRRRRNPRDSSITDLAFFEGKLLVSGLKASGSPSSVREIDFPFIADDRGIGVQIYHGAHGRDEDYAAMSTFVTLNIDGEPSLLAAYVCTPLVKIPLKKLEMDGKKVKGTTVAELGNRNQPLDMIAYKKDGADHLLLSNSARGVMKITTQGLAGNEGLSTRVKSGDTAGQKYETIKELQGVRQMTKLNETHAVVLIQKDRATPAVLKTVALP